LTDTVVDDPDSDCLDERGASMLQAVEDRDTPHAKEDLARGFIAATESEVGRLSARQTRLGGPDHINGIRRSGWTPWARFFKTNGLGFFLSDALLWFLCGARALVSTSWIILAAIALVFAYLGKRAGHHIAMVRCTDATSAKQTTARLVQALRRTLIPIAIAAVLAVTTFLLPPQAAPWIVALGWIPLVTLNILLALSAGLCSALGEILSRPDRYDELERRLRQLRLLRHKLGKYLPAVLALLALVAPLAFAGTPDACGVFVDETLSADPADTKVAVDFVVDSILDYTAASRCQWTVAGKFGGDDIFERRTWIRVPSRPAIIDCHAAEPEPLAGHAGLLGYVRSVAEFRKGEAVQACERIMQARLAEYEQARIEFLHQLRSALLPRPRASPSHIRSFLEGAAKSGLYRSLLFVTDGLDNPRVSLEGLAIPAAVKLTLIIVRPRSKYASLGEALARVRQWMAVPGVRVATTGDLHPSFWVAQGE